MKKSILIFTTVLIAGCVFLFGCENGANVPVEPTQQVQSGPVQYELTLEMAHHGACSVAGAFVEEKISAERALDELAGVANEITKAVDSLYASKKKKKKLSGPIGIKSEEDGMCMLEGDIQDLRSYLSDYTVDQADRKVVVKMIRQIKTTDYSEFNK